jgi:hypothetical protein
MLTRPAVATAPRCSSGSRSWVALAALLMACAPDPPTGVRSEPARRPRLAIEAATTPQVIHHQTPLPTTSLVQAINLAADFTIPPGPGWRLDDITLVGQAVYHTFMIDLRRDAGGGPGDLVFSSTASPTGTPNPCCGGEVFDYVRSYQGHGTLLAPGTYWVIVRSSSFGPPFQAQRAAVVGAPVLWAPHLAPAGPWTPVTDLGQGVDIAFSVHGTPDTPANATTGLSATLDAIAYLEQGLLTSLHAKLNAALGAIAAGDAPGACRALRTFVAEVNALAGKKLSASHAAALAAEATRIMGLLGC